MTLLTGHMLVTVFACANSIAIISSSEVTVDARDIRISDVVQPDDISRLGSISAKIIAKVPKDALTLSMSHGDIITLLRRRVPGLTNVKTSRPEQVIKFRRKAQETQTDGAPTCYILRTDINIGQTLNPSDVLPSACKTETPSARISYSRHDNMLRAGKSYPAGTYLGTLYVDREGGIAKGQRLKMTVRVGHVEIERTVTALQSVHRPGGLFVSGDDGKVVRAQIAASQLDTQSGPR